MATGNGVLRGYLARHAQAAAVVAPVIASPPTPTRLAATAAAQAALALAGLTLGCEGGVSGVCSLAELPELLPEQSLLAIIEGGADRLGVVALSPGMIAGLIEMQTLGRLSPLPPEARRPTRADAALAADFIDAMLAGLNAAEGGALSGFRYASHLADPRPLPLMLEDRGFHTLRLALRLGPAGEREGVIFLALPLPHDAPRLTPPPSEDAAADAAPSEAAPRPSRPTLAGAMRAAPVFLAAILCRRRISLADLRALAPGTMLALPRQALTEARVETANGCLLAMGKLGEADGFHALRLLDKRAENQARPKIEEPPIGDLSQPDAFRAEADTGLRHWQEALAEGRHTG